MPTCEVTGEECPARNCADGCKAQEVKEVGDSLNDDVTFTLEAAADLTQVPKMFRKMALKTIIKAAVKDGVSEIDREMAIKFKP